MEEKHSSFNLKTFLVSPVGKVVLTVILYFVVMWFIYLLTVIFNESGIVILAIGISLCYFGWQALSRITPNMFLIMPIGGWIAYYVVKGVLSFFLGVFVAPYIISKKIIASIERTLS